MTPARVARITPDPQLAADFMARAKEFAGDAVHPGLTRESRQVLMHSAVIAGCDAVLAIEGRRIVGSDGGHQLRLQETESRLSGDNWELFERLDDARVARNEVSYGATVLAADWEDAARDVSELLKLAEEHLAPRIAGAEG